MYSCEYETKLTSTIRNDDVWKQIVGARGAAEVNPILIMLKEAKVVGIALQTSNKACSFALCLVLIFSSSPMSPSPSSVVTTTATTIIMITYVTIVRESNCRQCSGRILGERRGGVSLSGSGRGQAGGRQGLSNERSGPVAQRRHPTAWRIRRQTRLEDRPMKYLWEEQRNVLFTFI